MTRYLTAYGITVVVFLIIDFIWLSQITRSFYFERLQHLMMDQPNFVAAAGFYLFYVIGIVVFAINPAFQSGSATTALIYGALFGLLAYATYDMTNYATLRDWPIEVVVVDIIWGGVLTGTSAVLGYLGTRMFFPE